MDQPLIPRGITSTNCQFDSGTIRKNVEDSKLVNTSHFRIYEPISSSSELMIGAGDVCYQVKNTNVERSLTREAQQQPLVLSILNNVLVQGDADFMTALRAEPNERVRVRMMQREFLRHIRIIGPCIKNVFHPNQPGTDPPDNPVCAKSGLMSMTNSGIYQIEAGQVIIATLPDPFQHLTQANSLVNSMSFSSQRRILQTTPIGKVAMPIDLVELRRYMEIFELFTNFIANNIAPNALAVPAGYAVNIRNAANVKTNLDRYLAEDANQFDTRLTTMKTEMERLFLAAEQERTMDTPQNKFLRMDLYNKMITDPEIADMFRRISEPFRDAINEINQMRIGVAVSSAKPNHLFEVMINTQSTI